MLVAEHPTSFDEQNGRLADYAHVRRAIAYLSEHWQEQPGLRPLADHLGLSPAYCQRLFKRWCGLSPKAFLQAISIDQARRTLTGSASLLDASFAAGLSGPGRLHDLFLDHEAMTPGDYKRRGAGLEIVYGFHASPFGLALIMATAHGICGIGFCDDDMGREATLADMTARWPAARYIESAAVTAPLARRIFGSRPATDGTPLRIVMIGTDFEVRVWEALLHVPAGQVCSYGDIARHIGRPSASRAVGAAVGRNPISFVVPCHRVVGASGKLTGYHWGITRKQAIIGWEKGRIAAAAAGTAT
jgi:AraC family transcriptional regulator of adaptative response/methylated-DNA-[protein]-cysteine methyltransferase